MTSRIDELTPNFTEDRSPVKDIGGEIADIIGDLGYDDEEGILFLVQAIIILAAGDDTLLDKAANFLADGGV